MNMINHFTKDVDILIANNPGTAKKLEQLGYTDKEFVDRKLKSLERETWIKIEED